MTNTFRRFLSAAALSGAFMFSAIPSHSAEIEIGRSSGQNIIVVKGKMVFGDVDRFKSLTETVPSAMVFFNSPGGEISTGLLIGTIISEKGFATGVSSNEECKSACAFAWLGGRVRFAYPNSSIGFHGAWQWNEGKAVPSASANALIGAYMMQIGIPVNGIIWATETGPSEYAYLTQEVAAKLGIKAVFVGNTAPMVKTIPIPEPALRN